MKSVRIITKSMSDQIASKKIEKKQKKVLTTCVHVCYIAGVLRMIGILRIDTAATQKRSQEMKEKKLYVNEENVEAIKAVIDAAEGMASVRTLTVDDLRSKLADAETVLMWPSKKALAGTRIRVHASTKKLPSAYRYRADSTQAVCEHDGKGWVLVEVVRDRLRQSAVYKRGLEIEPSDSARDHIMATLAFC